MKTIAVLKYLLLSLLFGGISCDELVVDQTFTLGKATTFQSGKLYSSTDNQFSFLITEISDSRCPQGVVCVWSGEVILKGEWTVNKIKSTFELHSVMKDLQREPDGISIQITDAKPYPKADTTSRPEDMLITLLIQKK
jgi:hypothetical protein